MSNVRHVLNYAIKFEQAYAARDWTLIEPCFTPEATYVVSGAAAFAGTHEGREAVLRYFAAVTEGFDRRFDAREVLVVDGPAEREGCLWFRWAAIYHLAGAPTSEWKARASPRSAVTRSRGSRIASRPRRAPASPRTSNDTKHGSRRRADRDSRLTGRDAGGRVVPTAPPTRGAAGAAPRAPRPSAVQHVAAALLQLDHAGIAELAEPLVQHRRRDTRRSAPATRAKRQRAVAQLPQHAQRPAPAEPLEHVHDRPPAA